MEILDEQLATASTADDFVAMLATSLRQMLDEDPDFLVLIFELFTLSRRNEEIAAEFAELLRRTREHVAEVLEAKEAEGVLHLRADAGRDRRRALLAGRRARHAADRRSRSTTSGRRSTRPCWRSARSSTTADRPGVM